MLKRNIHSAKSEHVASELARMRKAHEHQKITLMIKQELARPL